MTAKEQLQSELTGLGVKFDKRLAEAKLQTLLDETKAKFKAIEEDLTGVTKMTSDELTQGDRTDVGIIRKSGILIPTEVMNGIKKTRWVYFSEDTEETSVVKKEHGRNIQYVREYTRQIHGDTFLELSHGFVDKNNRRA